MITTSVAGKLLLPVLLAMDVYHRDLKGGILPVMDGKETSIDQVAPLTGSLAKREIPRIGFFAKTYSQGNTIYIVYRGTDDGSLDIEHNASQMEQTVLSSNGQPWLCSASM